MDNERQGKPQHLDTRQSSASDHYDPSTAVLSCSNSPRKTVQPAYPGRSAQLYYLVQAPRALPEDIIEEVVVVLDQERDSLSTLESMSEARITRHELPVGLMARMKASVKTWRRAAS